MAQHYNVMMGIGQVLLRKEVVLGPHFIAKNVKRKGEAETDINDVLYLQHNKLPGVVKLSGCGHPSHPDSGIF